MKTKEQLLKMKLKELRILAPKVKANSVVSFVKKMETETDYFNQPVPIDNENYLSDDELYDLEAAERSLKEADDEVKGMFDINFKTDAEREAYQAAMADIETEYPEIKETLPEVKTNLDKIKETVPDYFNKALAVETGCECWEDNMIYFFNAQHSITAEFQDAIIRYFREVFNQRLKRSMCSPCLRARTNKIKEEFSKHFKIECYGK